MSDRIAVMLDGHVEQLDDPDTIYESPSSAFVAAFIGQNNFWEGVATENGMVTPDGTVFVSDRRAHVVPGAPALTAVRPEAVSLSSTDPGSFVNATAGTIAGVSHLGDVLQFVVRTESESDLIARLPRHQAPKLVPGDPVWCAWSPEHAYVFSADQSDRVIIDPVDETVS
jgi:spermidine/putrescine transport system ATP-binding protein